MREHSTLDHFLSHTESGIRAMFSMLGMGPNASSDDHVLMEDGLQARDKKVSARLMRVNHAGEVAAQGLYHGQAYTARDEKVKQHMQDCAREEQAHLDWCKKRLTELNDRPSALAPAWYLGSYAIGATVGLLGDQWSLGFVSETEKQVVRHLDKHLSRLPENDKKSQEILQRIRDDEARHDANAQDAGVHEIPKFARHLMQATSKVMTKTAYWA
ncbi:MAG: 2-polyprenyl-3-methyl-6-methoxy-1,4-benzoquinone monooxygenase [Proteobacteria bacterium]|nr:2-polyprenyl-3-methyl-6-methoxy-1,4-benzoquinone monooxygenase [Pseudomonadota bacterium]